MSSKIILLSSITILLLSGCTAKLTDPDQIDFSPPTYVEQMPAQEVEDRFAPTGSIFGQGDNPLFSDHKAMRVNDIVTVTITETIKTTNSANKQLSESDNAALGGGVFGGLGGANGQAQGAMGTATGFTDVGFKTNSTSSFKGAGSSSRDASFTTTVSARIVKVLENGNYFITGRREIMVDNEKQLIQLSGVIRPYDIDQYNKIKSENMSDAKISYNSQGDVAKSNEQGWGTKLIQSVWPF
ncbi:MAG: flagellar basal body L-ring protein FlgH [Helicobacteraceae bacterium]|nr:flagellar basal body L-ring protein FlgH [Helicobacteraceae bacterium]